MNLFNIIKNQLIEVIEWTDDSRDTLSYRWPDEDKEIKNGAQLIVRESQQVQFVAAGQYADLFGPGKHTLSTENVPVLSTILGWKYGFQSPFKCDVYYINTRLFTGNKWGTSNPVLMRDKDFGVVRIRAFGTYDFRIVEPAKFLKEVAGTDQNFRIDEFADTMRSRIVSVFTEALAKAQVPVLDVATRYGDLGNALVQIINPAMVEKYGLKPMAKLIGWGQGGVDPKIMGVGPVPASRQALKKAGLTIDDIDLVEANEAFAAQSIAVARELHFDMSKVNVNGGAIALGHPVGASGARIIVTLLHEMQKRPEAKRGLATLCIGGGMGVATIYEKC